MQEHFYIDVLDHIDEGVYFVDRSRRITYWNRGAAQITGFAPEEALGRRCSGGMLRHVDDAGRLLCTNACPLLAVMADGITREADVFLHHKGGHRVAVRVRASAIRDESGGIIGSIETFHQRNPAPQSTPAGGDSHDGLTDPLTGLGSARLGQAQLDSILALVADEVTTLGLLVLDLDPPYRDQPPAAGEPVSSATAMAEHDEVVALVSRGLSAGLADGDLPVRWEGSQFLVLLPGATRKSLLATAQRLRMLVATSWLDRPDGPIRATVSVGAALAESGEKAVDLLERATRLAGLARAAGGDLVSCEAGILPRRWPEAALRQDAWATSGQLDRVAAAENS